MKMPPPILKKQQMTAIPGNGMAVIFLLDRKTSVARINPVFRY